MGRENRMDDITWSNDTRAFLDNFEGRQILISMPEFNSPPHHFHITSEAMLDNVFKELTKINEAPRFEGSFFTINDLDKSLDKKRNRTGKMWERGRALYGDDDVKRKEPRSDFDLEPNLVVKSSTDLDGLSKFHYYWLILNGVIDKHDYQAVESSLVAKYDFDGNAKDVTRYLRIPGFNHNKDKENPVEVVYYDNKIPLYGWESLKEVFGGYSGLGGEFSSRTSNTEYISKSESGKSIELSKREIIEGIAYHQNILSLTYQMAMEKMPKDMIIMAIEGVMNSVPENIRFVDGDSSRWESRFKDIKRLTEGAFEREKDEFVYSEPEVEKAGKNTNLEWPPGNMGVLARDIHKMMEFPNKEIAIVSAFCLVFVLSGRKNSFNNISLSMEIKLYAKTAVGKDTIRRIVDLALIHIKELYEENPVRYSWASNYNSFKPLGKAFGTSAIISAIRERLSLLMIVPESGIAEESTAGDKASVKQFEMQNMGTRAYSEVSTGAFSQKMPDVHAVSLLVLRETTKESEDRDAHDQGTGGYGRGIKVHCGHSSDFLNLETRKEFSKESVEIIIGLYKQAVIGEDFDREIKLNSSPNATKYKGPSTIAVREDKKVLFKSGNKVKEILVELRKAEHERRNEFIEGVDCDRVWAEQSRLEFRCLKLSFYLGLADYATSSIPIVKEEHLEYTKRFYKEIDRADAANDGDFDDDTTKLVNLIHKHGNKTLKGSMKTMYVNKHGTQGGTKGAQELFDNKIIFDSFITAANTGNLVKQADKMHKSNNNKFRNRAHALSSAYQQGGSEGKWDYIPKLYKNGMPNKENEYGVDYLKF